MIVTKKSNFINGSYVPKLVMDKNLQNKILLQDKEIRELRSQLNSLLNLQNKSKSEMENLKRDNKHLMERIASHREKSKRISITVSNINNFLFNKKNEEDFMEQSESDESQIKRKRKETNSIITISPPNRHNDRNMNLENKNIPSDQNFESSSSDDDKLLEKSAINLQKFQTIMLGKERKTVQSLSIGPSIKLI